MRRSKFLILFEQVEEADTGQRPMTVQEWEKLQRKYHSARDEAARKLEAQKIRQWKR